MRLLNAHTDQLSSAKRVDTLRCILTIGGLMLTGFIGGQIRADADWCASSGAQPLREHSCQRLNPDRVMALTILLALVEKIRHTAPEQIRTAARCHRA